MKTCLYRSSFRRLAFIVLLGFALSFSKGHGQTLLLHYDFDQSTGTSAVDSAANPANGTLTGTGSSWTSLGLPSNFQAQHVYRNNGANGSYVSAGNATKLDALGSFTITGWLNVRNVDIANFAQDRVLSKRGSTGSYFDLIFVDLGTGNIGLRLDISTGSTGGTSQISSSALDLDGWFFFAVSRDATTGAIQFFYGTPEGTLTSAGGGVGATGALASNTAAFLIGNTQANTGRAPDADFSDFRVYEGALNSAAIQTIQFDAIPEASTYTLLFSSTLLLLLLQVSSKKKHSLVEKSIQ